jgi:hypothetical protein
LEHIISVPIGFAPVSVNEIYWLAGELPIVKVDRELGCPSIVGSISRGVARLAVTSTVGFGF